MTMSVEEKVEQKISQYQMKLQILERIRKEKLNDSKN